MSKLLFLKVAWRDETIFSNMFCLKVIAFLLIRRLSKFLSFYSSLKPFGILFSFLLL